MFAKNKQGVSKNKHRKSNSNSDNQKQQRQQQQGPKPIIQSIVPFKLCKIFRPAQKRDRLQQNHRFVEQQERPKVPCPKVPRCIGTYSWFFSISFGGLTKGDPQGKKHKRQNNKVIKSYWEK
jgi:hypothetical protein